MGAWIEMIYMSVRFVHQHVAPLVGAWIEISYVLPPSKNTCVAPLVGAWIEMSIGTIKLRTANSRSPCGSVD